MIAVNLEGVLACTHAVLPAMQEAGYGRIVNIASEAGRVGSKGSAVYSAAKGGVIAFTKVIARENARFGITANAIAPGPIETPLLMRGQASSARSASEIIETMKAATQLRRLGQPEEVAAAVAFLASDDASYVTGETLGRLRRPGDGLMAEGRTTARPKPLRDTVPRSSGPSTATLEPGIERTDEFVVEGRLLTDVGGTIGVERALDPGHDRDDGAERGDALLRAPARGQGDRRLRGLRQARRRRRGGPDLHGRARSCARSSTAASCASTSRSRRASARSASAPTSAA